MKKPHRPSLASLLEGFFRQRLAAQRRASPATVSAYRDGLKLLIVFAAERAGRKASQLRLEDLGQEVVLAFLEHLEVERGNSILTRNARRAAIRAFFQYVAYQDPEGAGVAARVLAIPGKRASRRVVGYLRKADLELVLAAPNRESVLGQRDHALLLFLAGTGARVSEAVQVNLADLRLESPTQVLLHGKGSKDRVVPLRDDLVAALRGLCRARGLPIDSPEPLFVNAGGQRLTRYGVGYIVKHVVAHAAERAPALKSSSVSPHTLRHTAAMTLLQAGVDLTTIRSWLGHASEETTHIYIEADVEMKRQALARCEPTNVPPDIYRPTDEVLALLESL